MRGPPITVKCDCGRVNHVPYGDTWTCETCGRRWNTNQIPADEYWGIMNRQRRFRYQAMGMAVGLAAIFVILGFKLGSQFFAMAPVVIGFWFIVYMPQWRRKVRRHARSLPTWHLTPE